MSRQAVIDSGAESSASSPGWFGKVVMLGDFAHRRLPPVFVSTCDHWLSRCISASRAQLGSRWLDTYLTGPVWCFAWAPGVVDERWWFGVLMPSVDAVGRYFPLVVAGSDHNPPMSSGAFDGLADWYAHAGEAALSTLRPGATINGFETDLAHAPRWHRSAPRADVEVLTGHQRLTLVGQASLPAWGAALAGPMVRSSSAGHGYWMALDDARASTHSNHLTMVKGLPEPDQFSQMLEGRW